MRRNILNKVCVYIQSRSKYLRSNIQVSPTFASNLKQIKCDVLILAQLEVFLNILIIIMFQITIMDKLLVYF